MKVKSLYIKEYRHLQELKFDFTYPEGHKDFGQPLKNICVIGQSATGKTSIVELIKSSITKLSAVELIGGFLSHMYDLDFNGELELGVDDSNYLLNKNSIVKNGTKYRSGMASGTVEAFVHERLRMLFFSAEVISRDVINIFNQNPISIFNSFPSEIRQNSAKKFIEDSYIYEFGPDLSANVWLGLLSDILNYRMEFTQMASELINKGAIGDLTKLNKEFEKWSKQHINPLHDFAKHFNPILNKLNLEVDLINTEYSVPIKSLINDEVIPISGLSTGTKGLLLSMFSLYELDTQDAIILMDEPERSLFPDMQIELVSHYQQLAPNAQFIIATHSPFIAAAFEPEERFVLYFDKEGKVAVRRGESPIGDDPNDMLSNDFNVQYYNEFGKKAYKDYVALKKSIQKETNPNKKKELVAKRAALGDKYNFE